LLTALIIPWVMAYNLIASPAKFVQIAEAFGEKTAALPQIEAARLSVKAVKSLLDDVGISYKLSDYGVPPEQFPEIARDAAGAQRFMRNNPRAVTEADVIGLLEANY
jgi:alcohol dehydrogenase